MKTTVMRKINVSDRDGYVMIGEIVERFGTSVSWVERRIADSGFPRGVKFGRGNRRFWKFSEITAWERKRAVAG
jgi:predicted DNA-binding transcriptional regulator AlpA